MKEKARCSWPSNDPLMEEYHDKEWGVPSKDDKHQFEHHILEVFQAGLSWRTILHRREGFRKAFAGFDPKKVSKFDEKDVKRLLADVGIIRNKLKVRSAINNASRFLEIIKEHGSFYNFLLQFKPKNRKIFSDLSQLPAETPESAALSKELKNLGFKFVGPTTCYAHMQSIGIVNDHIKSCFRHKEIMKMHK